MQKAVIIMGSRSDLDFARKISASFDEYNIPCDLRIASAHRTPEYLLRMLVEYSSSKDEIVIVAVAGLSDALSGVVAAQRLFPVVACPPDSDKLGFPKIFSSAFTPSDVPVAFVNDPTKAAHFVAQIFALSNEKLGQVMATKLQEKKRQIVEMDSEMRK